MRWLIAAIFAAALFAACGGDAPSPSGSPSPSPTTGPSITSDRTATLSPTPSPQASTYGTLITRGPDIELPNDMALIIESGCYGCDGGPGPLWRIYRALSGEVRKEKVFDTLLAKYPDNAGLTGHASLADASVIAAAVCLKGACERGGLFNFDPDSEAAVVRSTDGGVTWEEIGRGGPVYTIETVLANGKVIIYNGTTQASTNTDRMYILLPDGIELEQPAVEDYVWPVAFGNTILWNTSGGELLTSVGRQFLSPDVSSITLYHRPLLGVDDPDKGGALVDWHASASAPKYERSILTELDVSLPQASISRQWEIDGILATLGAWTPKDDRVVLSVVPRTPDFRYQSPLPAIVDLVHNTYNVIPDPFFDSEQAGFSNLGRTYVRAVQTGPFARVANTGSCLNVRAGPSTGGQVLACAADGVLLRNTGDISPPDWMGVVTPSGVQGWASTEFLEY